MADDSGGVANLSKHKVLVLILPTHSANVITIARSQLGGRSIRRLLCKEPVFSSKRRWLNVLRTEHSCKNFNSAREWLAYSAMVLRSGG